MTKLIGEAAKRNKELESESKSLETQVMAMNDAVNKLELKINEGQLQRYECLEKTVWRQRKLRFLEEVKRGKYRLVHKVEGVIEGEGNKQDKLCYTLREVLDALLEDFPGLKLQIKQIMNTLEPMELQKTALEPVPPIGDDL